jgi:uncharacterized membrane protein (DUF2068 family)
VRSGSEAQAPQRGALALLAIAVLKLGKSAVLVALGVAALSVARNAHTLVQLRHVMAELGFGPYNRLVNRAFSAVTGIDHRRLAVIGIATFVYAAVFLIEGVGLLLRKRWAEYLTTIITGSFVPLEVYELIHKPSVLKVVGIAVNVLIVLYLVLRLWRERAKPGALALARTSLPTAT